MERAVPSGKFEIRQKKDRIFFYPDSVLREKGIYFVAERKRDNSYLVHDDGTIFEAVSSEAMDTVDVVREMRFGSRSHGFTFKEGKVYTKVTEDQIPAVVRRLERFATEVYHKATVGLGGD